MAGGWARCRVCPACALTSKWEAAVKGAASTPAALSLPSPVCLSSVSRISSAWAAGVGKGEEIGLVLERIVDEGS